MSQKRGTNEVNFRNSGATIPAYRIVKPNGAGSVALHDTATALIIGVSQEQSGDSGTSVWVAINGTAKGQCGASVSSGALLTALTATGAIVEATHVLNTTTTVIPYSLGISLEAGSTNAVIEVTVAPNNVRVAFA